MENIKAKLKSDPNSKETIEALIDHITFEEASNKKQIQQIRTEVDRLKQKVKTLEQINASLLKERNIQVIRDYSEKLVDFMANNQFNEFKQMIEEHDYPISEYIHEGHDFNYMTLLHYAVEMNLPDFSKYLIMKGSDVNKPDKKVEKLIYLLYRINGHH
jgi:hypothetical protein